MLKISLQKGFTLVETLIAIAILMIALAGPLALSQAGLFSSIQQKNEITAFYLAQEAIEYLKNTRDNNTYLKQNWLAGFDTSGDPCYNGNKCDVDPHGATPSTRIINCNGTCSPLNLTTYSDQSLMYSHANTGTPTTFTRTIQISDVNPAPNPGDEVQVTVTVTWRDGGLNRSFVVSENMFNYEQ